MQEDRRESPRRVASLPAEIETSAGKSSVAITRDVSERGLLVFSRRTLTVGDAVKIKLVQGNVIHVVTGTVLRQDSLNPEDSTVWRTKVAVVVDGGDEVLGSVLAALD